MLKYILDKKTVVIYEVNYLSSWILF